MCETKRRFAFKFAFKFHSVCPKAFVVPGLESSFSTTKLRRRNRNKKRRRSFVSYFVDLSNSNVARALRASAAHSRVAQLHAARGPQLRVVGGVLVFRERVAAWIVPVVCALPQLLRGAHVS